MTTKVRPVSESPAFNYHCNISNATNYSSQLTDKLNNMDTSAKRFTHRQQFENVTPNSSAPASPPLGPQSQSSRSDSPIPSKVSDSSSRHSNTPSQFIFKKPEYDKHYHHTHFHHHLEKKDTIFHELKRFFKKGEKKKKRSLKDNVSEGSGGSSTTGSQLSFANDFNKDIERHYGKWGNFVGKGSGGSVRIIRRSLDGKTFAVKEFRKRNPGENYKEYVKKVTAEFCIGSTLHHFNVIEALDLIQEGHSFYEIMEYAPNDLFNVVMSGKMTMEEINCCWRQLLQGVEYLHSSGIAHRDLKLDNLMMDEKGIIKIIDFGCATVFKYPFESDVHLSKGVCGSDPYIAPELYTDKQYDARKTDLWSCGIIYICMIIRRFPWKLPHPEKDQSYRNFVKPDNSGAKQLFDMLPCYAKSSISRILVPDSQERCLLVDILQDEWVKSIETCHPDVPAQNHPHHLIVQPRKEAIQRGNIVVLSKQEE